MCLVDRLLGFKLLCFAFPYQINAFSIRVRLRLNFFGKVLIRFTATSPGPRRQAEQPINREQNLPLPGVNVSLEWESSAHWPSEAAPICLKDLLADI